MSRWNVVFMFAPQSCFDVAPSPEFNPTIQKLDFLRRQPPTRGPTIFLNVVNGGRLGNGNHSVFEMHQLSAT